MGTTKNLMDVMNEVSSALDAGSFAAKPSRTSYSPLGEMDAFRSLDPLLASLYKEYLNTKQIRLQAAREYGVDEAMTEMAQLAEDSAWCAMQTRYMEVRADRAMMCEAQAMMEESLRDCERAEKERKEQDALAFLAKVQMIQSMREEAEKHDRDHIEFLIAVLVLFTRTFPVFGVSYHASYQFNRLAA